MPVRSLIAFTGGLDSTYLLQEELKKGHDVEVVYAYLTHDISARLAELTARRRLLNYFNQLYPGQIKDEWVTIDPALWVCQGGPYNGRTQLVQQYNTMTSLIQVILQGDKNHHYRPMTGWHYQDVMENNPKELQSEATYTLYKQIFASLVRSVDPERHIVCGLTTPVWNVSKEEMWHSLDGWIQANISTGYYYYLDTQRNGATLLTDQSAAKKVAEYRGLGINLTTSTTTHFTLLAPLDRYFLGATSDCCDVSSPLLKRCKEYYDTFKTQPAKAINLAWMKKLSTHHLK